MKSELSKSDKKDLAMHLFYDTDKSQKEIADLLGISERTMSQWKQAGMWEEIKQAQTATSKAIIVNLYKRIFDLSTQPNKADEIVKLSSAVERLKDQKITLPQYINAFTDLCKHLISINHPLLKEINKIQNDFILKKINE